MRIYEIVSTKPLNPEQARLRNLKYQVKRAKDAVKAEKARQKIKAGQKQLAKLVSFWC
jgi:hypothetical protein